MSGAVNGTEQTGGLVGRNLGTLIACYATSSVSSTGGNGGVGGLVGDNSGSITTCYTTGSVSGQWYVGGLVGWNDKDSGTLTACFWDTETSGQSGSAGGTGKTTIVMKTLSTFTSAGWDFSTTDGDSAVWYIPNNDYPRLFWEREDSSSSFHLTIQILGSGTVSPQEGTYSLNTKVTLLAVPDAGYRVKSWKGTDNDSLTTTSNTVVMNSDKTVTAEFEEITDDVMSIAVLTVKAGKTRD